MDFLGTALDATTGVALALTGRDFLGGAAFFAWAAAIGLEGLEILLGAFVDVLLLTFLLIFTLFLATNLEVAVFLTGATGFFAATTFFGLVIAFVGAVFALLRAGDFLAGAAASLVLATICGAGLALGCAAALAGLAVTFFAAIRLALAAGAFFTGAAFFATGFLAAGLDAFVFFGVGMVQPSVMKRIGWRRQQSDALAGKRGHMNERTGTLWQAVRANIWIAVLAVGWPR
jgi:hypothetical protein